MVLTDLMMPDMTGWQLLREIKERDPRIPVAIITGYAPEHGREILTNSQVDGYIVKPATHQELETLLRGILYEENLGRQAEVLILDDEDDDLEAMRVSLSRRGLQCVCCRTGEEALERIRRRVPDMTVVDLQLPGAMDGLAFVRRLRTDGDTAGIPVLIVTSHASRGNVSRALDLKVNGFVAKPFDPDELGEKAIQVLRASGLGVG